MRKRELLKRIEELEKSVAVLQQKVANIENRPIAPIQINPWIKEDPPQREYIFTRVGDSTSRYTI